MTAEAILHELLERGIHPALTDDGTGIVVPAGVLTDAQRQAIKGCKTELIERIRESARLTSELLQAAMRCCDHHRDNPAAREAMRQDVLGTPPLLQADLLDYLQTHYPDTKGQP